jgi:hypothetical protein
MRQNNSNHKKEFKVFFFISVLVIIRLFALVYHWLVPPLPDSNALSWIETDSTNDWQTPITIFVEKRMIN